MYNHMGSIVHLCVGVSSEDYKKPTLKDLYKINKECSIKEGLVSLIKINRSIMITNVV